MSQIQWEKVNLIDLIVVCALSAALMVSIYSCMNELSMSITSGLLGYIGGTVKSAVKKEADAK